MKLSANKTLIIKLGNIQMLYVLYSSIKTHSTTISPKFLKDIWDFLIRVMKELNH